MSPTMNATPGVYSAEASIGADQPFSSTKERAVNLYPGEWNRVDVAVPLLAEEGFEGAGAPSGWSAVTTHGTVDWDAAGDPLVGAQSLELDWTSPGTNPDTTLYVQSSTSSADRGADYTRLRFAFKIDAAMTMTEGQFIYAAYLSDGGNSHLYVRLARSGANWALNLAQNAPWVSTSTDYGDIAVDVTYYAEGRFYPDTTTGGDTLQLFSDPSYTTPVADTYLSTLGSGWSGEYETDSVRLGSSAAGDLAVDGVIQFDSVRVDDIYLDQPVETFSGVEHETVLLGLEDCENYTTLLAEETFEGSGKPSGWGDGTDHGTIDYDNTTNPLAGSQDVKLTWNVPGSNPDSRVFASPDSFTAASASSEYTRLRFVYKIDSAFTQSNSIDSEVCSVLQSGQIRGYLYLSSDGSGDLAFDLYSTYPAGRTSGTHGNVSKNTVYYIELRVYSDSATGGMQLLVYSDSSYSTEVTNLALSSVGGGWTGDVLLTDLIIGTLASADKGMDGSWQYDNISIVDVFEPTGWTDVETHGTVDWTNAEGPLHGTQDLKLTWANAGDPDTVVHTWAAFTAGSASSRYTAMRFAIQLDSGITIPTSTGSQMIAGIRTTTGGGLINFYYATDGSDDLRFSIYKFAGGGTDGSDALSYGDVVIGTTYYVEIRFYPTASVGAAALVFSDSAYSTQVGSTMEVAQTWSGVAPARAYLGNTNSATADVAGSIYYDDITVVDVHDPPGWTSVETHGTVDWCQTTNPISNDGGLELDWTGSAGNPDTVVYVQKDFTEQDPNADYLRLRFTFKPDAGFTNTGITAVAKLRDSTSNRAEVFWSHASGDSRIALYQYNNSANNLGTSGEVSAGTQYWCELRVYPDQSTGGARVITYSDPGYINSVSDVSTVGTGWSQESAIDRLVLGMDSSWDRNPSGVIQFDAVRVDDMYATPADGGGEDGPTDAQGATMNYIQLTGVNW